MSRIGGAKGFFTSPRIRLTIQSGGGMLYFFLLFRSVTTGDIMTLPGSYARIKRTVLAARPEWHLLERREEVNRYRGDGTFSRPPLMNGLPLEFRNTI